MDSKKSSKFEWTSNISNKEESSKGEFFNFGVSIVLSAFGEVISIKSISGSLIWSIESPKKILVILTLLYTSLLNFALNIDWLFLIFTLCFGISIWKPIHWFLSVLMAYKTNETLSDFSFYTRTKSSIEFEGAYLWKSEFLVNNFSQCWMLLTIFFPSMTKWFSLNSLEWWFEPWTVIPKI